MKKLVIMTLMVLLIGGANAYAYTVVHNPGVDVKVTDISTQITTGGTMKGLGITINYSGGGHEVVRWSGAGIDSGQVSGNGWSLSLSGNSWAAPWVLDTSVAIDSISFRALSGGSVFDVMYPDEGTSGSDIGWNFDPWGYETVDVTATYSNRVNINGDPWGGDLYSHLGIVFNDDGGFTGHYEFYSDTDNVSVPIPSTILLLGGGLLGLFGWRKRKTH